ncbi:hypothetical protein COMA2_40172 [Candidatus Nitrospira nitrificans]|uniref:Uncharacterized protein n=1 Tax=Candidatus Nitrospira nitrificans TaxID=1742973 RepID=A0A0S4LKF1_9BACT|nr:hypothetical protein COMA2_40172 [Candidatus Nitrospira nitrificans]
MSGHTQTVQTILVNLLPELAQSAVLLRHQKRGIPSNAPFDKKHVRAGLGGRAVPLLAVSKNKPGQDRWKFS